ncbi:putative reverse transcriptase domain-containing protein [Tanacetum coccineum]
MKENLHLSHISTLAGLCISLVKTEKRESYCMIDRLIRLILTLLVSTTTTERVFSAMKICKNRLRNKMADDFLVDNLVVYIEKEIAESFSSEYVVDVFKNLKGRKADLSCGVEMSILDSHDESLKVFLYESKDSTGHYDYLI